KGEGGFVEQTFPPLPQLDPDFCSVTYGAGGSTRDKTLAIVDRIQRQQQLTAMAHLTCVKGHAEETLAYLEDARYRGIKNILALRGDPVNGAANFTATAGGFEYSYQ